MNVLTAEFRRSAVAYEAMARAADVLVDACRAAAEATDPDDIEAAERFRNP